MTYVLEAMDQSGTWYNLGTYHLSGIAQVDMRYYREIYSDLPMRVVEEPTRKLVLLNDPRQL